MTAGPDHFREAERDIARADHAHDDDRAYLMARAQVHATLALAAATATQLTAQYVELDEDAFAWNEVAGVPPRGIEDVPIPYGEGDDCDLGVGHTGPYMHLSEVTP